MEVFPKVHVDIGEEKKQVVFGGQRATRFIKDVVAGKSVNGIRYNFDHNFIMEVYNRVSMAPHVKGFLRQSDSTTVGGEPVGPYLQLGLKMYLFGRWFGEAMETLKNNPEDLILALQIAAGAHFGLTQPSFHPFDNGNGRTARALMNTVLMSQSYELTAFGLAVPPIPILRTDKDEGHYIKSLRAVGQTKTLNPFMAFIAQKWIESLDERINKIQEKTKNPKTHADALLLDKLENRRRLLKEFVKPLDHHNGNGHPADYQLYPIPDYFKPRHIRMTNAKAI